MNLSKFVEYVKVHAVWKNKPDKSTPVNADALMTIESGIKANNEAISELAAAVVSEIANDPNKIANMAALYAVQQAAFPKANLVNQIVNDATKAASAAALYSVNETLKQTNSNLKLIFKASSITDSCNANGSGLYSYSNFSGDKKGGPADESRGILLNIQDEIWPGTGGTMYQLFFSWNNKLYTRRWINGEDYGVWTEK